MKKIVFHPHAIEALRARELSAEVVIAAVTEPTRIVSGRLGRRVAQRMMGKYVLRVIYEETERELLIITAYLARKERY